LLLYNFVSLFSVCVFTGFYSMSSKATTPHSSSNQSKRKRSEPAQSQEKKSSARDRSLAQDAGSFAGKALVDFISQEVPAGMVFGVDTRRALGQFVVDYIGVLAEGVAAKQGIYNSKGEFSHALHQIKDQTTTQGIASYAENRSRNYLELDDFGLGQPARAGGDN
jgi:hypothetical protein